MDRRCTKRNGYGMNERRCPPFWKRVDDTITNSSVLSSIGSSRCSSCSSFLTRPDNKAREKKVGERESSRAGLSPRPVYVKKSRVEILRPRMDARRRILDGFEGKFGGRGNRLEIGRQGYGGITTPFRVNGSPVYLILSQRKKGFGSRFKEFLKIFISIHVLRMW